VSRQGTHTRGRVAGVALAAALTLTPLLAACGTTQAGAAAIVGGRRISVEQVQTATEQVRALLRDSSLSQQLVLGWLIANPYVVTVAGEQGKAVSRNDAVTLFRQANVTSSSGGTTPSEAAVTAVQTGYALQLLTSPQTSTPESAKKAIDEILADLKAAKVSVNPRYGTFDYSWDAQTGAFGLSPRKEPWIVTPTPGAAQPSPTSS
jgi:hypothetical protein